MEEKNKKPLDNVDAEACALLDRIFQESYPKLVKYAYISLYGSVSGDVGRAEDVVQESMITAIKNADRFVSSDNPFGWLMRVVRYTAKNYARSDQRFTALITEYTHLADTVTTTHHSVDFSLSDIIPKEDFQLLKQYYLEGYNYAELKASLGLSTSALSMRLKRAKSKFIKNYFLESGKLDTTEHDKIGGVQNANEQQ